MRQLPAWAAWNAAAAEHPWTVGIEEELMILDPRRWSIANRVDDVLAALPPAFARHASPEPHGCVVELKSTVATTVGGVAAQLAYLRSGLARTLRELGLRAAAAGIHPLATGSDVSASVGPRSRILAATMGALSRREPTMALHVHVAMPDGETAVRALDGLRHELPLLLALSANSPFWRGADSGFASIRSPIFSMFPRVGIPRRFGTYAAYVRVVDTMLRSAAIPEPGFMWWDARLQPRLGTVELRIMDAQSRVGDVAAVAALAHCVVARCAREGERYRAPDPEVLAENRFLAARDGLRATFIDATGGRRAATDALAELLDECRPFAASLGCVSELGAVAALAEDPGYERQRRLADENGLSALPANLADELEAVDIGAVAA